MVSHFILVHLLYISMWLYICLTVFGSGQAFVMGSPVSD